MTQVSKKGLLLVNLGSPDTSSVKDVQRYLNEFLMDGRVVDFPVLFRFLLMRCLVVPRRAPKSAEAYRQIWTKEGSPLVLLTEKLKDAVAGRLQVPTAMSMRYQNPTPQKAFTQLLQQNPDLEELLVLPLYPHYTMSSYDTAVAHIKRAHKKGGYGFKLNFFSPFYQHPRYVAALAESIRPYLDTDFDTLLFSYHGIPERHLAKDRVRIAKGPIDDYVLPEVDYQQQCFHTTRLVCAHLGLPEEKAQSSFQSRLTSAGTEWAKPYTILRLAELPAEGTKKLLVVCPSFINDCLETLEEIAISGKASFLEAGGESLTYIPCLNDHEALVQLITEWFEAGHNLS